VTVAIALALQLSQVPATPPAPPDPSQIQTTPAAEAEPPPDPATSAFATDAGLLLVVIKADKVEDYDAAIRALQEALAKDPDPARKQVAAGWRVFKAVEPDGKGNAVYVHALWPAVPAFDYRPSMLIDQLVTDAPPELLEKYREAFASPPTKLSLTEFAHMAVAPAPVTASEVAPEAGTPAPPVPKKPGG